MDRRTKQRLDLQLVCRVGLDKIVSAPVAFSETLISENVSRTGILLRWLPEVALPLIGEKLSVDVELPNLSGNTPRVMRCTTQVVRVDGLTAPNPLVALTIRRIRFVAAKERPHIPDLASMTPATPLVN